MSDERPLAIVDIDGVVDDDRAVLTAMRQAGHPTLHANWEVRAAPAQAALFEAQEGDGRT